MTDPENRRARHPSTARDRAFPGGRARLPLLTQTADEGGPQLQYVESAFLRSSEQQEERPPSGFEEYFSTESLFHSGPAEEAAQKDAWEVLGVAHDAPWSEVVKVHRQLAKSFHPDRFANADDEQRRWAEDSIRSINHAFRELRDIYSAKA